MRKSFTRSCGWIFDSYNREWRQYQNCLHKRKISVKIGEEVIRDHFASWKSRLSKIRLGYVQRYTHLVRSADEEAASKEKRVDCL
ncbi:hypothetical protein KEJ37_06115 [Candidatus Bathyarchaeota archaeon]|nr:hypothetical protein [Candidatus Bathyarchaeota archaeon]